MVISVRSRVIKCMIYLLRKKERETFTLKSRDSNRFTNVIIYSSLKVAKPYIL